VKRLILLCFCIATVTDALASGKDFKSLFGSYRREKYTENEGNSSDFGVDIMLSTLLPVTPVVNNQEAVGGLQNPLYYSAFFNVEGEIFYSLHYNWQLFLNLGYFNYDTRRQEGANTTCGLAGQICFSQFNMTAFPALLGVKYRLGSEDIVPYIGIGAGVAWVTRKGSYDNNQTLFGQYSETAPSGEAILGVEFYISSRAGIRLEASAYYMNLKPLTYTTNAAPENFPILYMQGSVWSVRYASGVFVLF
jgi:hypothetical protein